MKKGTIIKNLWAGHETYFVYMGFPVRTRKGEAEATSGYVLVKADDGWQFSREKYYVHVLKDTEHFPVVGYIDPNRLNRTIADAILNAIAEGAEEPGGQRRE